MRGHLGGQLARVPFSDFGQGHAAVGLVVAELGIAGRRGRRPRRSADRPLPESPRRRRPAIVRGHSWQGLGFSRSRRLPIRTEAGVRSVGSRFVAGPTPAPVGDRPAASLGRGDAGRWLESSAPPLEPRGVAPDLLEGVISCGLPRRKCGPRSRRSRSRSSGLPPNPPARACARRRFFISASISLAMAWLSRREFAVAITKKSSSGVAWRRSRSRMSLARLSSAIRAAIRACSSARYTRSGITPVHGLGGMSSWADRIDRPRSGLRPRGWALSQR